MLDSGVTAGICEAMGLVYGISELNGAEAPTKRGWRKLIQHGGEMEHGGIVQRWLDTTRTSRTTPRACWSEQGMPAWGSGWGGLGSTSQAQMWFAGLKILLLCVL